MAITITAIKNPTLKFNPSSYFIAKLEDAIRAANRILKRGDREITLFFSMGTKNGALGSCTYKGKTKRTITLYLPAFRNYRGMRKTLLMLNTLAHEIAHAVLNNSYGHNKTFRRVHTLILKAMNLEGENLYGKATKRVVKVRRRI